MDIESFFHVWIAHCEFHSLMFLFISESEEAFFNKTTENVELLLSSFVLSLVNCIQNNIQFLNSDAELWIEIFMPRITSSVYISV